MPDIKTQARQPRLQLRFISLLARQLVALVAVCTLLWILQELFAAVDLAAMRSVVARVSPQQWAMAAIAALASFMAVGRYDAVLHGLLGTNITECNARRSGMMAIATAQFACHVAVRRIRHSDGGTGSLAHVAATFAVAGDPIVAGCLDVFSGGLGRIHRDHAATPAIRRTGSATCGCCSDPMRNRPCGLVNLAAIIPAATTVGAGDGYHCRPCSD